MKRKLKRLFEMQTETDHFLADPVNGFFVRVSSLFNEFLQLYREKKSEEDILVHLRKKTSGDEIKMLFNKMDTHSDSLFITEKKGERNNFIRPDYINTLTLNVTNDCNLECKYCFEKPNPEMRRNQRKEMRADVAIHALDLYLQQLPVKSGYVVFSGGEPLLNFRTIKKVVDYANNRSKVPVRFSMKTNGILITEEVASCIRDNDFMVQISLDGPAAVHDRYRVFADGKGSYEKVMRGIDRLISKNCREKFSLLGVLTHENSGKLRNSLAHLSNFQGGMCAINPVMADDEAAFALTDEDLVQYMDLILSGMGFQPDHIFQPGFIKKMIERLTPICGIGLWNVSVDFDGTVYPCYRLSGIEELRMGNIFENGMKLTVPQKIIDLYEDRKKRCNNCYANLFCHRGCYAQKYIDRSLDKCACNEKRIADIMFKRILSDPKITERFLQI